MGDTGLEHPGLTPPITPISGKPCAESGALDNQSPPSDPDLNRLNQAWPDLPEHIKQQINGLVRSHMWGGTDE